jgi:hypothetical protein
MSQQPQQYPQQNYCWESSTSSCSEEDENDSDICFDIKSDNDGFELFDEMIKTETFEHQQNFHLQGPHLQHQDQPSLASLPPIGLCSDTSASLSPCEKLLQPRMISPSMIKSEMSPCFEENTVMATGQMHQQPMHSSPEHHQQQPQQQIMGSFGTSTLNNSQQSANNDQIDIYRDLILRHLIQDIGSTCSKLYLPTNPLYWNCEHANRWILEMCHQFHLPLPSAPLNLNGQALLEMTQAQLCQKMPEGGDTLHAQLHLWKTASENNQSSENASVEMQNCGSIVHHRSSDSTCSSNGWMSPTTPTKSGMNEHYGVMNYSNGYDQRSQDMNMYYGMQHQQQQNLGYQQSLPQMIPQQQDHQRIGSRQFFMYNQQILPSPSDSEISSNSSNCLQDATDDDCSDIHYMASNYVPPPQSLCQPLNSPTNAYRMPMHNTSMNIPQLGMNVSTCAPSAAVVPPVVAYSRNTGTVHLWHFIRELLDQPKQYGSCVRWVDREEGTFKIESSHHLARYWGQRKNRSQMNYDKLSRSLRQYYKKGIIQKPEKKQRLVYKFLPPYNL